MRASNPLLTKEQERAAMERLLNKGTRSVSCLLVRARIIGLTRTRCSGESDSFAEAMRGIA